MRVNHSVPIRTRLAEKTWDPEQIQHGGVQLS